MAEPPVNRTNAELWVARGETGAFQIVVSAGGEPLTGVNVDFESLKGPRDAVLEPTVFTLYREHYVHVSKSSPDFGFGNRPLGTGWYADALIPRGIPKQNNAPWRELEAFPFRVERDQNQPLWVDVNVPRDAEPGVYRSRIRIVSGRGDASVFLTVHIWPFTLPVTPTLKSSFGMHEPALFSSDIESLLVEHRVMPVNINPEHAPDLQRAGLNITGLRVWGNSDATRCLIDPPPDPAAFAAELAHYPSNLPVYVYSADEVRACPQLFPKLREWAASMHAADPRIRQLVTIPPTPTLYDDGTGNKRSGVDIWVVLPKFYQDSRANIEAVRSKGDEVWSYTALVQDSYSPKWLIDFSPMNYRILPGFLSQALGLSGVLYWRVDLWTHAPWTDVYGFGIESNSYPGEGMLIYPVGLGLGHTAIPSLRLKWIRMGVNDYEYVAILTRMGKRDWAMAHIRRVASDWGNWTEDERAVESVRRELGDEIARLTSTPAN